jgi:hypothetical protein
MYQFLQKNDWATFRANFSQTHLVTLKKRDQSPSGHICIPVHICKGVFTTVTNKQTLLFRRTALGQTSRAA